MKTLTFIYRYYKWLKLTSAGRCRADTEGNSSLHSLHLTSLSALLVSSLFGVSALLGRGSSFSLRGLWSRLQELTGKLAVMLEEQSCLSESHSSSHVRTDPAETLLLQHRRTTSASLQLCEYPLSDIELLADTDPAGMNSLSFSTHHSHSVEL